MILNVFSKLLNASQGHSITVLFLSATDSLNIIRGSSEQPARVDLKKLNLALCMPVSNYGTLKDDETPAGECAHWWTTHITPVAGTKALCGKVSI